MRCTYKAINVTQINMMRLPVALYSNSKTLIMKIGHLANRLLKELASTLDDRYCVSFLTEFSKRVSDHTESCHYRHPEHVSFITQKT